MKKLAHLISIFLVISGYIQCSVGQDSLNISSVATMFNHWGNVNGVAFFDDDFALVAVQNHGIAVMDISYPADPVEIHTIIPYYNPYSIVLQDNYAYIACMMDGIATLEISDIYQPQILDFTGKRYLPEFIEMKSDHIITTGYTCEYFDNDHDGYDLLTLYNIEEIIPDSIILEFLQHDGGRHNAIDDVALSDTLVFIDRGIIRIEDEFGENFEWTGVIRISGTGIAEKDGNVFIKNQDTLHVLTIDNIEEPEIVGQYVNNEINFEAKLNIKGNILIAYSLNYYNNNANNVALLDITDPLNPDLLTHFPLDDSIGQVDYSDSLVLVANSSKFGIWDISNPENPTEVGEYFDPGRPECVAVYEHYAYISDGINGIQIVDIDEPETPEIVGRIVTDARNMIKMVVKNAVLYAQKDSSITVYSLENPDSPDSCSNILILEGYVIKSFALTENDVACISYDNWRAGRGYFLLYDLADPYHPSQAHNMFDGFRYQAIICMTSQNNILYLIDINYPQPHLLALDLTFPDAPDTLDILNSRGYNNISIAGNNLYLATVHLGEEHTTEITIIDADDPEDLTIINRIWHNNLYYDTRLYSTHGSMILTSRHPWYENNFSGTISIFDTSDPLDLHLTGYYETANPATSLEIYDHYLLVPQGRWFQILDAYDAGVSVEKPVSLELPHNLELHPTYPNPFNSYTLINFEIPKPCHAELAVFNLTGRLVKVLSEGTLSAGRYQETWDGCDLTGNEAASGIYFVKLSNGYESRIEKTVLIR
ncbi:MAG: T9SS type A sorting domain-containing protein [Candidatus Electryonea clarkiae]|nr:T9SS type A sorting domain-containing protein [Candidatus Electryonea clarkiae]MDP8287956.1 T9SS type A sorting domain-containing protein [Candidatus Electryonea clarkiae]